MSSKYTRSLDGLFKEVYADSFGEIFPSKPGKFHFGPIVGFAEFTFFKKDRVEKTFYLIGNKWLNEDEYRNVVFKSDMKGILDDL